ncbi:MAG: hypothetical protein C0593_01780 [Marinilabiliales bacterium]|nr:MAG: hypothetical protein C0593_01780 [Marinilabiliales bacterium]
METIQKATGCEIIWEPFHSTGINVIKPRIQSRVFPDHLNQPGIIKEFEAIFTGKKYNIWTEKMNPIIPKGRRPFPLVKSVRIHPSLDWLSANFPTNHPPIFLVRHPIPTSLSKIKNFDLTDNIISEETQNHIPPHISKDSIPKISTALEKQVLYWCIHNYTGLKRNTEKKWITVFYEDMVLNPEQVLPKIPCLRDFDLEKVLSDINKPSKSDFSGSYTKNNEDQLRRWERAIDDETKGKLQKILDLFDIDEYSCFDVLPIKQDAIH